MSRARDLSKIGNKSTLAVDTDNIEVGIGSTVPSSTLDVRGEIKVGTAVQLGSAGVVTATSFSGSGANLTGIANTATIVSTATTTGLLNVTGTTDSTSSTTGSVTIAGGVGIAKNVYIGAGLSVAGTLTYEDVTNVDSVGLITAKSGVNVSGGQVTIGTGITMGIAGVATFSGTSDVHLLDSVRLNVGDGSDLSIYHDGSHSYINDTGTGYILLGASQLNINNAANDENLARFIEGGACELYYNDSKKFETTNDGTVTTGIATATGGLEINADSKYLKIGASNDIEIWHDGTDSNIRNNTGTLLLRGSSIVLKSNDAGETLATFTDDGSVELRYDNSKKFETTGSGTTTTGIGTFSGGIHVPNGNANSDNIALGNGSELQLWHNGTYSAIQADTFKVVDKSNGHGMITADADGAVGLRYDNSQKFETTNDGVKITGIATCSNGLDTVGMLRESYNTVANKLSAAPNIDVYQGMVHYFTSTETTTATPNLRYTSTQALNDFMSAGDAITVTLITNAAAAGYSANWQIDGSNITEEWVGGSAPTAGGSDGYDIYTANVLKLGDASWKVFINLVNAT